MAAQLEVHVTNDPSSEAKFKILLILKKIVEVVYTSIYKVEKTLY